MKNSDVAISLVGFIFIGFVMINENPGSFVGRSLGSWIVVVGVGWEFVCFIEWFLDPR